MQNSFGLPPNWGIGGGGTGSCYSAFFCLPHRAAAAFFASAARFRLLNAAMPLGTLACPPLRPIWRMAFEMISALRGSSGIRTTEYHNRLLNTASPAGQLQCPAKIKHSHNNPFVEFSC